MARRIYGESVRGASHIRSGTVCQDSCKYVELPEDGFIIAVADGHGSASCPYSKSGSTIAVNVFCRIMQDVLTNFKDNMAALPTYLNREGDMKVAMSIDAEWKRRVWKAHLDNKREKLLTEDGEKNKPAVYKQYGTTLLGLVITPTFVFSYQLGDGDILFIDADGVQPVIEGDKILGVETHSLSKMDSWKKALTAVRMRDRSEGTPYLYLMATDGFANSHRTQADCYQTCRDYLFIIKEHGFDIVASNLKGWLMETSEMGCGDDITVVMAYEDGTEGDDSDAGSDGSGMQM